MRRVLVIERIGSFRGRDSRRKSGREVEEEESVWAVVYPDVISVDEREERKTESKMTS